MIKNSTWGCGFVWNNGGFYPESMDNNGNMLRSEAWDFEAPSAFVGGWEASPQFTAPENLVFSLFHLFIFDFSGSKNRLFSRLLGCWIDLPWSIWWFQTKHRSLCQAWHVGVISKTNSAVMLGRSTGILGVNPGESIGYPLVNIQKAIENDHL